MERPIDLRVLGAGVAVDELPAHVCRRCLAVDLDHVVFPFDPLRRVVAVLDLAVLGGASVSAVSFGVVARVFAVMLVVSVLAVLLVCFAFAMAVMSMLVMAFMLVAVAFLTVAVVVLVAMLTSGC